MDIVGVANAAEAAKGADPAQLGSLAMAAGWIGVIFIGLLAVVVLYKILIDKIDLMYVISEEDGSASLSRFQFLVFTFVIAASFIMVAIHTGKLPDVPAGVWGLLGISGGSYIISKGIQKSGSGAPENQPTPTPAGAAGGQQPGAAG